jgi:hypothetical protein
VLLTFHSALRKLNTEPSIGASHQVSVHLAKQFQRRRFKKINQPETRIAALIYKQCLAHLAKGKVSFCHHLASVVRRPLTFHILIFKLDTEPSIGASHQVSVHLAKQFQRRRFLKINQLETRIAYGSQPNELKLGRKYPWKVLYKNCSFRPDPLTNMATIDNSCF